VVTLTSEGIYSFEAKASGTQLFDSMEPIDLAQQRKQFGNLNISVGTCVPSTDATWRSEVWVCDRSRSKLHIVDPKTLKVLSCLEYSTEELQQPGTPHWSSEMVTRIKDMKAFQVIDDEVKVVVADNCMLLLWDATRRKLEGILDCRKYCKAHQQDDKSKPSHKICFSILHLLIQ